MTEAINSSQPGRQSKTPRRLIRPADEDLGWRREKDRAALIADFWLERGARVSVRVEPVSEHHGATIWGVRSDLLGGLPRQQSISHNKSLIK
jgi:hypothetical protein